MNKNDLTIPLSLRPVCKAGLGMAPILIRLLCGLTEVTHISAKALSFGSYVFAYV